MGQMLAIQADVASPAGLRRRAKKEPNRRAALRMLAIANALEGMSRADAARVVGIERQSLCDAIRRVNAEGSARLYVHPKGHRRPVLSEGEEAALIVRIQRGRDPDRTRVSPPAGRCRTGAASLRSGLPSPWGPQSMARVVRRLGLSRQTTRPVHPRCDEGGRSLRKRGLLSAGEAAAAPHPDQRIALWFQGEARVGQKGRIAHRW